MQAGTPLPVLLRITWEWTGNMCLGQTEALREAHTNIFTLSDFALAPVVTGQRSAPRLLKNHLRHTNQVPPLPTLRFVSPPEGPEKHSCSPRPSFSEAQDLATRSRIKKSVHRNAGNRFHLTSCFPFFFIQIRALHL